MRLRKGMVVAVVFDDHAKCADTALRFVAYGRVAVVDKKFIVIDSWHYADPAAARDDNIERYTIVRSTIRGVTRLVPAAASAPA
jgi:hypothetical protein